MKIGNTSGFTLIEIISVLVLMGIIATFTLIFIVSFVSGYIFTKQNAVLAQKASLAMSRITAELTSEMKEITSSTISSVKYIYQYDPTGDHYRHIVLVGGARKKIIVKTVDAVSMAPVDTDPEVLVDQVKSFTLTFQKYNSGTGTWVAWAISDDMDDLSRIIIALELYLSPTETDTRPFETTITPPDFKSVIGAAGTAFLPGEERKICRKTMTSGFLQIPS